MADGMQKGQLPVKAAGLKGVGGWLAFLIVFMGVASPLFSLYFFIRNTPEWHEGVGMSFVVELASCALFMMAGWRLYRYRVWRSVRFAVFALWVGSFALSVFIFLFTFPFLGGTRTWQLFDTARLLKQLVYPAVWTLYLLMSVRVRNTYRRESKKEELARHLGVKR